MVVVVFVGGLGGFGTAGYLSSPGAAKNIPAASTDLAGVPQSGSTLDRKAQFAVEESPIFAGSPASPIVSRAPDFNLSGVIYSDFSPKDSFCIINDKIVKVGEVVDGAKLLSVSQNMATVEYQGKEITLSVGND